MKIAVNTRLLIKDKLTGIGRFTYETLQRIARTHSAHEFFFIFDRPYDKEFVFSPNVTPLVIGPPTRHPLLYYIWFEWQLPRLLRKIQPDLFLSPDGYLSLSYAGKMLPVIHDLNFFHRPQDLPWVYRTYYNYFFPRFARRADRIATVSEYSKQDIATSYHISPDKIDVVYNGAGNVFRPLSETEKSKVREQYTAGNPYFIFVGSLHPRKNLITLLKAFEQFRKHDIHAHKLVVVGENMWGGHKLESLLSEMNHGADVIFSGHVQEKELGRMLAAASALTYIPFFEGFGIPIIEAMCCETPVITSSVTSMPEVAGDAAVLVSPDNIAEVTAAMQKIVSDQFFRQELIRKSRERTMIFSWEKTAEKLWDSIEKTVYNK